MGDLKRRWVVASVVGVILLGAAGLGGIGARPAVAQQEPGLVAKGGNPVDRRLAEVLEAHSAEQGRLEARVRTAKEKLLAETVSRLQALQDEHCRAARLDEALVVREEIRRLQREAAAGDAKASPPAIVAPSPPDSLSRLQAETGAEHRFTVTGSNRGIAWGTDVYTLDSNLSVAAVHAGVLAVGETGVVKVTIVDSPAEHVGSHRHGITTHSWPRYRMSFRVERVGAVPAVPPLPARPLSPYDRAPPPPTAAAEPSPAEAEPSAPAPIERVAPRRPFD
jgi:hypothetical protein